MVQKSDSREAQSEDEEKERLFLAKTGHFRQVPFGGNKLASCLLLTFLLLLTGFSFHHKSGPKFVSAKGLVGKLPGNFPTKSPPCPEESCSSDPQHVLHALKIMGFVFLLVLALPVILYFLSKLCSLLCGGAGQDAGGSGGSSWDGKNGDKVNSSKRKKNKLNKCVDYEAGEANFTDEDDAAGEAKQQHHLHHLQSADCPKSAEGFAVKFQQPAGNKKKRGSGQQQEQLEPTFPGGAVVDRRPSNLSPRVAARHQQTTPERPPSNQSTNMKFNHDIAQQNLQLLQMMTDNSQQQQIDIENTNSIKRKSSASGHRANGRRIYPEVNSEQLEYPDSASQFQQVSKFTGNYPSQQHGHNNEQYFRYQATPEETQMSPVDHPYGERSQQGRQLEQKSLQPRPTRSPKQTGKPVNNSNTLLLPASSQLHRHSIDCSILNKMVYGMQLGQDQISNQHQQSQVAKFNHYNNQDNNEPSEQQLEFVPRGLPVGRGSSRQLAVNGTPGSSSSRRKQLTQKLSSSRQNNTGRTTSKQLLLAYEPQKLAIQQADRRPSLNAALMQQQRHHL